MFHDAVHSIDIFDFWRGRFDGSLVYRGLVMEIPERVLLTEVVSMSGRRLHKFPVLDVGVLIGVKRDSFSWFGYGLEWQLDAFDLRQENFGVVSFEPVMGLVQVFLVLIRISLAFLYAIHVSEDLPLLLDGPPQVRLIQYFDLSLQLLHVLFHFLHVKDFFQDLLKDVEVGVLACLEASLPEHFDLILSSYWNVEIFAEFEEVTLLDLVGDLTEFVECEVTNI